MMLTIRKTRFPLFLVLTLGLLVVSLAGCGSSPAATTEVATPEPTTIVAAPAPTTPPQAETETAAEAVAVETAEASTETETVASPERTDSRRTFVMDAARSQVRFYIDEELLGQPKRVEGINSQVAGEMTVNLGNYAEIDFSPITVAANAFVTDNDRRNGAINRFVLQTSQYPTLTFTPTGVENLPAEIAVGQPFSFQLVGDLTIRDVTSSVTLEMTVTPVSESEIQGSGSVTVQQGTFDLSIPSVPSVANVSEDVLLEIDFVAVGK